MSVYAPEAYGISPLACAQDCLDRCREQFPGFPAVDPAAYQECLYGCQSSCPGGAPALTPGLEGDYCLGPTGVIRCTVRDTAGAIVTGIGAAGRNPMLTLLAITLGAVALAYIAGRLG